MDTIRTTLTQVNPKCSPKTETVPQTTVTKVTRSVVLQLKPLIQGWTLLTGELRHSKESQAIVGLLLRGLGLAAQGGSAGPLMCECGGWRVATSSPHSLTHSTHSTHSTSRVRPLPHHSPNHYQNRLSSARIRITVLGLFWLYVVLTPDLIAIFG